MHRLLVVPEPDEVLWGPSPRVLERYLPLVLEKLGLVRGVHGGYLWSVGMLLQSVGTVLQGL